MLLLDEPGVVRLGFPLGELLLGFVLGHAVALLDLAGELVAAAGDDIEVVVGQLAPLLLGLAGDLLPVAFDLVPVHVNLLVVCGWMSNGCNHAPSVHGRTAISFFTDLHAVDLARQALGGALLGGALGEARQHHGAVERLDADGRGVDGRVVDEAGLHRGGDGGVVDVGADGFLAARDRATGGRDEGNGSNDGCEGCA